MPDYCMCRGGGCNLRNECFRFRAKPSKGRQSYFLDVPNTGDECEYFMTIGGWPDRMLMELEPDNEDRDLAVIESPIHDQDHN